MSAYTLQLTFGKYYFGNHNLPRDKFLKEQIKLDDGWVPLEVMIKFNREKEEKQKQAADAEMGIILFKDIAKEALEKAKAAHNGNLQLRNKDVSWEVLEGDAEKEALKKILEDQQELLKQKTKGRKIKGKGRGGKIPQGAQKGKIQFQGKKIKFENDEEDGENETKTVTTI
ncbi:hypothetical protein IHE44_0014443 [Lamprotornis superbus]|uniref:HTH La-type RNA-binding domain-containing protein n=1 Tax=Lamprotornis superbus TaxID=245042 RepID=A0A835P0R1_9PASS|nr:hypothetical protein IHE44_0014443 [Lamprotornis superbus]